MPLHFVSQFYSTSIVLYRNNTDLQAMVHILGAAVMLTLPSVHINLMNKSAQKHAKYRQFYSKNIFIIRGRKKHLINRNCAVLYTSRASHL